MKRKLATNRHGACHQGTGPSLRAGADLVDQRVRECRSLGLTSSAAWDSRTGELPAAASARWIAWWLNLRLD
jgi:hypothetical protein